MEAKLIEKFLKTADQATFQHMMNHLLFLEGYDFMGAPGSVVAKNKTSKGGPDSFFRDGDNFIFCEYTTVDRSDNPKVFLSKLEKDIDHCFDEPKTGIANNKITKVILACNDEILPAELTGLKARVKTHNSAAELITYSIQEIPLRLLYYPGLADRYIPGIKTTKGSFFTIPDFINITKKGIQPALDNPFLGRQPDLEAIRQHLETADILVLTGGQGIGKSKLAIEAAQRLKAGGYEARVIGPGPAPILEDLQRFLLPDKKYILVFDDANKALSNLEYLLLFMRDRPDGKIKLILTVRDYVRQDLNRYLADTIFRRYDLEPLGSTELRKILEAAVPAGTRIGGAYLEQMTTIAKGNARLAMMALRSAEGGLAQSYLHNVQDLYEYYFQKLEADLAIVSDPARLKALGILAFFDKLNLAYAPFRETLNKDFGINADDFRETLLELERAELVDFFTPDICRMSDQVLSTYTFYKTFLDPQSAVIDYALWLMIFFDAAAERTRRTLVDLNNTFGHARTKEIVLPHLLRYRQLIEKDDEALLKFYQLCWAYLEPDTLVFAGRLVDELPDPAPEVMAKALGQPDERAFFIPSDLVGLLQQFWRNPTGYATEALRIGLRLLLKEPGRTAEMSQVLQESFKFSRFDHLKDYERQARYLDWLCTPGTTDAEKTLLNYLFLQFLPALFNWEFFELTNNGLEQIIHTARLIKLPGLVALRRKALAHLFMLAANGHQAPARELMLKYLRPGMGFDNSLYAEEADLVHPFFLAAYDPQNYRDIELVSEYLDLIEAQGAVVPPEFDVFRSNQLVTIAEDLLFRKTDFVIGDFDQRERDKRAHMAALAKGRDLAAIRTYFQQADRLYQQSGNTGNNHWIEMSMSFYIEAIASDNPDRFLEAMAILITDNYHFARNLHSVIGYPLSIGVDSDRFYAILEGHDYEQKDYWKQLFFEHLPQAAVNPVYLKAFISFLQIQQGRVNYREMDFLQNYEAVYPSSRGNLPDIGPGLENSYTYVTALLLQRVAKTEVGLDRRLAQKFGKHFTGKPELLQQAYDLQRSQDQHFDANGQELSVLLQYAPTAILDLLRSDAAAPGFNESRLYKYDLIWDLPDAVTLLDQAIDIVIGKRPILFNSDHWINALFKKRQQQGPKRDGALIYIRGYIDRHIRDKQRIAYIFNVVTYSYTSDLLPLLRQFLLQNQDPAFVDGLMLEKEEVIHGDLVPVLEQQMDLYESFISLARSLHDTMGYTAHIAYWEQIILGLKASAASAALHNFTGPR